MIFKDAAFLLLLPALIPFAYLLKRRAVSSSIRFSSGELIKDLRPTFKMSLMKNLVYLRTAAMALIIMGLTRPCVPLEETKIPAEGIDIVLTLDCSGSMLAEDFKIDNRRQNRIEAVKNVVKDFIRGRSSDRIGLVAFAARAYTVCPLTLDYDWLIKNLGRIKVGIIEDGTAIGSGIASSLNRLKNSKAKSKIIILLTDGINNTGKIPPQTAAEIAKTLGIKIYSIGAGSKGLVPYPMRTFWGEIIYQDVKIELDEDILQKIASETNGKYFRATDTESLREIYKEIDSLEKTKVEEKGYQEYKELFPRFLVPGLMILILEVILASTVLRKLP